MMNEQECGICGLTSKEAELVDAILDREIGKVCGICAETTNLVIIRKPTSEQLKEAERPFTVFERLSRAAGIKLEPEEIKAREEGRKREEQITLAKLAARKSEKEVQEKKQITKSTQQINLVSNFSELIEKARKAKNMTQRQLANAIAESEEVINMLEKGKLPAESEKVLRKLEQFLRISIIQKQEQEEKQEIEKESIDFHSPRVSIADLRRMRDEMFGRKIVEEKEQGGGKVSENLGRYRKPQVSDEEKGGIGTLGSDEEEREDIGNAVSDEEAVKEEKEIVKDERSKEEVNDNIEKAAESVDASELLDDINKF